MTKIKLSMTLGISGTLEFVDEGYIATPSKWKKLPKKKTVLKLTHEEQIQLWKVIVQILKKHAKR